MIRKSDAHSANHAVYAVKKRPDSLDAALFHAPLPNVFHSAAVCWGTVQRVSDAALSGASLAEDWRQFLGTPFGNHATNSKSRSHKDDIRQKLIALDEKHARRYPTSDLIPARKTLAQAIGVST